MRRPTVGFTMVEVLVAVLLLAVGLVGALAMQGHAMRTRKEAALLGEALQAAASLAEHIRANSAQSSAYLGFAFDAGTQRSAHAPADCSGAPCGPAVLALHDLDEFGRQLQASLPSARALTCRDASSGPGGRPRWACSGGASAPIVIKVGWPGAGLLAEPVVALPVALAVPGGAP